MFIGLAEILTTVLAIFLLSDHCKQTKGQYTPTPIEDV